MLRPESNDWTIIRCDNAGENIVLPDAMIANGLKIKWEFTPPGTPQYNGVVERKFKTLYDRVRTLLNAAQLDDQLCVCVWTKCAKYATDIENMVVKPGYQRSSWEMLH